jgi:DNA-binding response OmpR family regulator
LVRLALGASSIERPTRVFSDGDQAIRFVDELDRRREICPALFLVDLNLPKRPGWDVLRRIRKSAVCGGVPVLVFSSSSAQVDRSEAIRLGAAGYLVKPSNFDEFLSIGEVIKTLMNGR